MTREIVLPSKELELLHGGRGNRADRVVVVCGIVDNEFVGSGLFLENREGRVLVLVAVLLEVGRVDSASDVVSLLYVFFLKKKNVFKVS